MWREIVDQMFVQQIPLTEKVLRTVIVYAAVAVLIRLIGKRGLGGLNTLDVVVIFLLSNVVQNAIIGADNSVVGGLIGAVVLIGVDQALNYWAVRNKTVERIFDGRPTTLIRDGVRDEPAIRRLGLRDADLRHAVRLQNGNDLSDVETAKLEPGGQLLLTLKKDRQGVTKADLDHLERQLAFQLQEIRAALLAR